MLVTEFLSYQLAYGNRRPMTKRFSLAAKNHRRKTAIPAKQNAHPIPQEKIRIHSKIKNPVHPARQGTPTLESDLFRAMMDNTSDRIYFKDAKSRFLLVNRSVAVWLGLSNPSEVVGKTDFDFFSEEHARQAYNDEKQILASGCPLVGIVEKETWPDGRETWVSTAKFPMRDKKGRIIGTFGISSDITEHILGEEARKIATALREANLELEKTNAALQKEIADRQQAEKALAYERDLFRTMMDNTTDHIYFKDTESRFILMNRSLAAWVGLTDPSEAIGKTDFDFFSEEHARQAYNDEKHIITSGQPLVGMEEKETWADGHETWVSTTKIPLRDREGRIIGTFGISRDITERKAIESSILQTNQELGKTNAALQAEIAERHRAEETLAYERDLFRTMMDNTSDHIYFKDSESHFTLMNRSLAGSFGLDYPSKGIGKTDFDFFTEEHARQAYTDEQRIMASGKPVVGLEEKETWPDGHETWVSSTKFPMRDREGRIIGTFGISRDITERKAMEVSIELATAKLADMVTWLEGRNREINVLNEMGKFLEACRSQDDAYQVISSQMERLIPVHAGRLYRLQGEHGQLEVAASWGEDQGPFEPIAPQDCLAIQTGRVHLVGGMHSGSYCPHLRLDPGEGPISICIPLIAQGETIGLIHLQNQPKQGGPETLPDAKQQLAITAADYITLALANLTLRESLRAQSIRDDLTGLFNRRYLEESFQRELARAQRKGTTLGVVMMDVDHLKRINDTFGHEAGDALLHGMGQWLQSNTRAEDISCRYGGDEFVLILPDSQLESTYQRARQFCAGIRELKLEFQGLPLGPAAVSIGVAEFPMHGKTRDELLAAVDAALYKAKEGGRNRVVLAAETSSSAPQSPADRTE
jgi:diguanylate cyclase (GGDEF)-like protein/PAS domain S-box-containing protein